MKVLILFAHPAFQNSTINKGLINGLDKIENLTFHDLYKNYPELDIDIDREQELLEQHDCIVFMFPMYWYSTPAIFKEWQDLVLEHDWAYGSKGNALKGKLFFCALSTGGPKRAFKPGEFQDHSIHEFLSPITQMAKRCNMTLLPPFVTHSGHIMEPDRLKIHHDSFHEMLHLLVKDELELENCCKHEYLNDYVKMEG